MFLSAEELSRLTGRMRPKAQMRQLTRQHVPFTVDADGQVLVLRTTIDAQLGTGEERRTTFKPNWSAI